MIKNDKYAKYVEAAKISNSKSLMPGKIFHVQLVPYASITVGHIIYDI